jgi:TPR repeat protein
VKWFQKAADLGDDSAMNGLGECYRDGVGVKKNLPEAVKWFRKSAAAGNAAARENLKALGVP